MGRVRRRGEETTEGPIRVEAIHDRRNYLLILIYKAFRSKSLQEQWNEAVDEDGISGMNFCRERGMHYVEFCSWLVYGTNSECEVEVKEYLENRRKGSHSKQQ